MSGIYIGENLARPLGVKSLCWRSERERSARGLLSLYELMHEVKIGEFMSILGRLRVYESIAAVEWHNPRGIMQNLESILVDLRKYADVKVLDFDDALNHQISFLQDVIDNDFPYGSTPHAKVEALVHSLLHSMEQLLRDRQFLYLPPKDARYYRSLELCLVWEICGLVAGLVLSLTEELVEFAAG